MLVIWKCLLLFLPLLFTYFNFFWLYQVAYGILVPWPGIEHVSPVVEVCVCEHIVTQLCLTLCDLIDCSPQDSSIHGIFQARILEQVAIPFFRRSSWPRVWTQVSCIAGRFFTIWVTREAPFPSSFLNLIPNRAKEPNRSQGIETSLVVQWIGIRLPVQGTQVWLLVWEESTCRGATKPEPTPQSLRVVTAEPAGCGYWGVCA